MKNGRKEKNTASYLHTAAILLEDGVRAAERLISQVEELREIWKDSKIKG